MTKIILSPHFDDAALSCGGWIADLCQRGKMVEVWTICTGLPAGDDFSPLANEYHGNWDLSAEEVIETRKNEDIRAMQVLGVPWRHFGLIDGLYRKHLQTGEHLYLDEDSLFGSLHPGDVDTVKLLAIKMAKALPEGEITIVSPLTIGNHVDHLLVRSAAEMLNVPIWYYPDYPYIREYPKTAPRLAPPGYIPRSVPVMDEALAFWQESVTAYASQISSFWSSLEEMRAEIAQFSQENGGIVLWQPPVA